jgi:hypothetical protein
MDDQGTNREGGDRMSGTPKRSRALFIIIALVVVGMGVCAAVVCFEAGELWPLALLFRGPVILIIGFVLLLPVVLAYRYRK